MSWPVFTYLALVSIHTPTRDMRFYDCPGQGIIQEYKAYDSTVEYRVTVACPHKRVLNEWIKQDNLAPLFRGK